MDPNADQSLVEEREENLFNFDGTSKSMRKGWFLKPPEYIPHSNVEIPFIPIMQRPTSGYLHKQALKVTFKGWSDPRPTWDGWIIKLRPIYEDVWKKADILDAIITSTNRIPKDFTSIWEVLPYWSYETNTFIFPFLEATITLEDMMVLGGFSPIGLCARGVEPLTGELEKLNLHLIRVHKSFNKMKTKKACFSTWMRHFMEGNDASFEHVAFLSLWLSKYVFPKAPGDVVQRKLFPIAILLAQGERFALGPSVLASLYRDMRLLKEHLTSSEKDEVLSIFIWAPFQVLQMWIWEHFVCTRQNAYPKFIDHNQPRATRWHNLAIKKIPYSGSLVQTPHNFQWRPYAKQLDNWSSPTYYRENGHWIYINDVKDEGVISFVQCLRACELVGLDSIQLYLPQRVSRQFGYDQDLLGCALTDVRISDWEVAWSIYKKKVLNCMLYVPSRDFESDVTCQYYSWWKERISPSRYLEIDTETLDKDMKMEEEISIPMQKKQRLLPDLNTTPLNLRDMPVELDESGRVNIRILKGIARRKQASSSGALAQNQLIQNANEGAKLSATGEEERRQDELHGCKNIEYICPDYGAKSSTSEDPEKHK